MTVLFIAAVVLAVIMWVSPPAGCIVSIPMTIFIFIPGILLLLVD